MKVQQMQARLLEGSLFPSPSQKIIFSLLLFLLTVASFYIVYQSGGTKYSYIHLFYIPIILGGTLFRWPGGIGVALVAVALTHPLLLPEDVERALPQSFHVWLFRGLFFLIIGGLSGYSATIFHQYLRMQEKRLRTDPITDLPNPLGLAEIYHQKYQANSLETPSLIVLMIRHLQEIDTALGHQSIENLLRAVGKDLCDITKGKGVVGSFGSGSLILFVPREEDVMPLIQMCQHRIGSIYTIDGLPIYMELHYGIVKLMDSHESFESYLRKAKIAAHRSIEENKIKQTFNPEDDTQSVRNMTLIHDLARAFQKHELTLQYQPKIDLQTGQICGVEALAHWKHPAYGMIPPKEFIPLIESTLLINDYTKWLLHKSVQQLAQWQDKGFPITLALNFSMRNFQDSSVIQEIYDTLHLYHIPLSQLEIELTESALAQNVPHVSDVLVSLREQGIKIAIDDFGTGHSTFSYLFELPFDILKIDQLFIHAMISNSAADAIVRSALLLGHELNLKVVAEGIEKKEEYEKVRTLGCDQAQGFWIARPMPGELATAWIESRLKGIPKSKQRVYEP